MKTFILKNHLTIAAAGLSLIGLLDVIGRYCIVGEIAWTYSLHDPGKILFHIVILPAAFLIYTRSEIWKKRRTIWRVFTPELKIFSGTLAVIIVTLGLVGGFMVDTQWRSGNSKAFIMPFDFPERATELVDLRSDIWKRIMDSDSVQKKNGELSKMCYKRLSARDIGPWSLTFETWYGFVAMLETFLAILFVGVVFMSAIIVALYNRMGHEISYDSLIASAAVIAPWILLRAYSDLYINFNEDVSPSIYVFAIVLFVFLLISTIINKPEGTITLVNTIYGAVISLATFFTATYDKYKEPFLFVTKLHWPLIILLWLIIVSPLLLFVLDKILPSVPGRTRKANQNKIDKIYILIRPNPKLHRHIRYRRRD